MIIKRFTQLRTFLFLCILGPSQLTFASSQGVIQVQSEFSVNETVQRLESMLLVKNVKIINKIDHASNAKSIEETLRPTVLVLFGNPKLGTPLMQCQQSVALDLPQKALIWEDEEGLVRVSYNDPAYLAKRHNISNCDKPLAKMSKALGEIIRGAATR